MVFMCGPPCRVGKTAAWILASKSYSGIDALDLLPDDLLTPESTGPRRKNMRPNVKYLRQQEKNGNAMQELFAQISSCFL